MSSDLKYIISSNLRRKKRICLLITFLLISCIFSEVTVYAKDTPTRTINVGYFEFTGYHELKGDGDNLRGSGYGYDFLKLLQRYTNLNYHYVGYENSWQDMQEMLRNGQIDMVTSARKTREREKEFAFSKPIGTSYAEMSVRADDDRYQYNDYDSFDGMRIGVLAGNSRNKDLVNYAKEKGFTYQSVEYADVSDLTQALKTGDVDAIVTSSLRKPVKEKVIARFALEEFYVIVRKDEKSLLEEINYGIDQMDLNEGDWRNKLYYKYTAEQPEDTLSFTQKEKDYIAAVQSGEKAITACAQPDRDPYSYVENGKLTGIIPDYVDYLMNMAGLPYTVKIAENRSQYYEWTENHSVDLYMDVNSENDAVLKDENGIFTDSYIQLTMSRVTKKDFKGTIHKVAIAYNQMFDGIDVDLAKNVQTIEFDTRKEALQAVKDGKADACYVYTYMAEKFVNQDSDSELISHMMNKPVFNMSVSIRPNTDHELISILNKCIKADQTHTLDELVETYTKYDKKEVTLGQLAKQHPEYFVILAIIVCAIGIIMVLIVKNNHNANKLAKERMEYAASLQSKNEQLGEAIQREQRANNARREFISNMSHDIRTPMNAIIGFTNIALKQHPDEAVCSCLEKIEDSSEHLLTLINDVLDLSRIESGKTEYSPVPTELCSIIDSVIAISQGFLTDRDLNFHVERNLPDQLYVFAEAVRIREVLVNILSNAVKFTNDGGTITFTSECHPGEDENHIVVRYSVKDTGIGMSDEFLAYIFDEFAQEESGARTQYKGTGLGMAITKRYVDMMGGTISVNSRKGVGTEFIVELPFKRAPEEAIKKQDNIIEKTDLNGVKVLLAEDNELNAEIATVQLEEYGIQITRVSNGKEAVDAFKMNPVDTFDLILMDIMMPVMNGHEATREIRMTHREDADKIPIIAMTANAFAEDVQASLEAGMNAHIIKPLVMEEVLRTIARNLDR